MALVWVAIFSVVIAVSLAWGGKDCQVPKTGPLHWLLKSHQFVATGSRWEACRKVK